MTYFDPPLAPTPSIAMVSAAEVLRPLNETPVKIQPGGSVTLETLVPGPDSSEARNCLAELGTWLAVLAEKTEG